MKKSFKKILASLLVAVMVLSVSPIDSISEIDFSSLFSVKAAALTSGKFTYELSGTNATITGYSGTDSNLTIPSKLDGKTVVAIKHGVFANNADLVSVSLPGTLTSIGYHNTSYDGTFQNCKKLQTVTFSEGSAEAVIGSEVFMGCLSLKTVSIPGNYTTIRRDAFNGCTSLKSFEWKKSSSSTPNQTIEQGVFAACSSLETVSLPKTLNYIGPWAFTACAIKDLVIPEGVTTIDHSAFANCGYLTSVSLPSTLITLGYHNTSYDGVFQNCTKLKTVNIAKGTKDATIGAEAFMGCAALQTINIPGNYTTLRRDAFLNCTALKSVVFEESDYTYANQTIEQGVFSGCSSLETVSLPKTLSYIGTWAFTACAIKDLVIPEGVKTIDHSAFANCANLKTVSLPSTLISLGYHNTSYDGVFQNCPKLEKVLFAEGNKDLTIGAETFKNCPGLTTVHLPSNLIDIKQEAFAGSTANLTICSKSNDSYGKKFADSNSIKFKVCSGHDMKIGDVNNDGNINSSDALLVLQYSVGSYALNGNAFTAADTNRDGKVNSSDALIILQFAVGKIDKI